LGKKLVGEQGAQQRIDGAPGIHDLGRQVAVGCMGDLIHVVADAAQLREQGRVHGAVGGADGHIDLAHEHQPLTQARDGQTELFGLGGFQRVIVIGHADADHAAARCLRVCASSRHSYCLTRLGSGRADAPA